MMAHIRLYLRWPVMLNWVLKGPSPNSLAYDVVRTHYLCVLSSSSPPPLGFQVPQVEQKETMREVNGEMQGG